MILQTTSSTRNFFTSKRSTFLLFILLAAVLLRAVLFVTSIQQLPETSDEASVFLLAEEISKGARPLLFTGQPYQFPVESYLLSPFVQWLPHNNLGIRYQALLLESLSFLVLFFLLKQFVKKEDLWLPLILLCFPSAYLLIFTFAYTVPQYSVSIFLATGSIFLANKARTNPRSQFSFIFLTGLMSGLMLSNHLLTISVAFAVLLYIFFDGRSILSGIKNSTVFITGAAIGLIPYIMAITQVEGAYENLPAMFPLDRIFSTATLSIITDAIGRVMGFSYPMIPDFYLTKVSSPRIVFFILFSLYCAVILFYGSKRIWSSIKDLSCGNWPQCNLGDLSLIITILTAVLFITHHNDTFKSRYLIFLVIVLPILVGQTFQSPSRKLRQLTAVFVCLFGVYNLSTYEKVFRDWRTPGEIQQMADTPDLTELVNTLEQQGISHCYASFWLAYRITYESRGNVTCSLPYNERFPGWPIPKKELTDSAADTVFVLSNTWSTRTAAWETEQRLKNQNISFKLQEVGNFKIFSDFNALDRHELELIETEQYTLSFQERKDDSPISIADISQWIPSGNQQKGQSILIDFKHPQKFAGVEIIHQPGIKSIPVLQLIAYLENCGKSEPISLSSMNGRKKEYFIFPDKHPVMFTEDFIKHYDPVTVNKLVVQIDWPMPTKIWKIGQLNLYRKKSSAPNEDDLSCSDETALLQ